ncbi:MAG: pyrimidine utilization transport protein G [Elusimicrobia bacterium]|nr:pyrimidine utilization transport protein G [Elusimicrobiota bacterium]
MVQPRLYYPEDKLPLTQLLPMGMQHVVAMFGATVLAPILMGFNPQVALFFSGVGTLIFAFTTAFKVPSYLGSSFAFIGPVLAVTGGDSSRIPLALCGIAGAAVLYGLAGLATMRWGSRWIDGLMPPVVTGTVVAIIGLNLAGSAVANCLNADIAVRTSADAVRLLISGLTFMTAAFVSIHLKGFLRLLPILIGAVTGYALSALLGALDPVAVDTVRVSPWLGLPPFQTPAWSGEALLAIAPIFVVLVAENKGHLAAISGYLKRDLNPYLGRAYLGDAVATLVSALGGGTPQTTYAENMGVMAITRVFSTWNFVVAACIAILLGLCPKFGALIQSIPSPVLGGITLILYGLIALMGVKIWIDAGVDFCSHKNLVVAGAPLIVATGMGVKGVTVGGVNIAGIALGTVLAVAAHLLLSLGSGRGEPAQDHVLCKEHRKGEVSA